MALFKPKDPKPPKEILSLSPLRDQCAMTIFSLKMANLPTNTPENILKSIAESSYKLADVFAGQHPAS